MRLLKVYRSLEKFLPMNFKFRFNSKRKQFSSCNNPFLKLRQRKIRASLSSSGKTPSQRTIGGVLMLHCCRSWTRHALSPCSLPRTSLVNNPQQSGADTTAVLLFPTNVPIKLAGVPTRLCRCALQLERGEVAPHVWCPQPARAVSEAPQTLQHPTLAGVPTLPAPFSLRGDLPHLWLTLVPRTWLYLIVFNLLLRVF